MKREDIHALAREAAKLIKTEKDISDFSRVFKKIIVETVLFELNGSEVHGNNFHVPPIPLTFFNLSLCLSDSLIFLINNFSDNYPVNAFKIFATLQTKY